MVRLSTRALSLKIYNLKVYRFYDSVGVILISSLFLKAFILVILFQIFCALVLSTLDKRLYNPRVFYEFKVFLNMCGTNARTLQNISKVLIFHTCVCTRMCVLNLRECVDMCFTTKMY